MQLRRFWLVAFSALLLIPFLADDGFSADGDYLTASLNKESYAAGEAITITGLVPSGNINPIIIQVISPNGNLAHIAQLEADSDNNFSEDIATSIGGKWKESGTYIIKVTHSYDTIQIQFE